MGPLVTQSKVEQDLISQNIYLAIMGESIVAILDNLWGVYIANILEKMGRSYLSLTFHHCHPGICDTWIHAFNQHPSFFFVFNEQAIYQLVQATIYFEI